MLEFFKYEGLGNDFVLVDERGGREPSLPVEVRSALCDRHRGIGADGVLTVLPPRQEGALARMHVTNADGSVPEMCGNGLRCVALFLVDQGAARPGHGFVVDTDAGPRRCVVHGDQVSVEMGEASFEVEGLVPRLVRAPIEADGGTYVGTAVSMGNPHLVLEADASALLAARIGPLLEVDPRFPQRANVELAEVRGERRLDVVVWERGVGLTQACGTGACAAAAAFVEAGRMPRGEDLVVALPGGPLVVRIPEPGGQVVLTGPARRVFEGRLQADAMRRTGGARG